jgi:hypothetical protein
MKVSRPTTVVVHPDYPQLASFVQNLDQRFLCGEGEVIYKGRNELRLMHDCGLNLVVKSFRRPNVINQWAYGLIRPSKAQRSYLHARMLQDIGVGTPQPIGYVHIYRGPLLNRSYYVSLMAQCPHVYTELFQREFPGAERILRAVAQTTARLHDHGYRLTDYSRGNILFDDTEDEVRIELVDLNRMKVGCVDVVAGCKNLERLPATPQMHHWLADEYAKLRGFDAEECFRLMQKFRSTQPGKIDGLY